MAFKSKRNALNRGTCVYVSKSRVKFIWACGCTRTETIKDKAHKRPVPPEMVRKLTDLWRHNGVILEQCKSHPDWYSRANQVPRLNAENPQP